MNNSKNDYEDQKSAGGCGCGGSCGCGQSDVVENNDCGCGNSNCGCKNSDEAPHHKQAHKHQHSK